MAEVLCVYREVQVLKKAAAKSRKAITRVAIVSYDEKPGIEAIATTAPDLRPKPGVSSHLCAGLRVQRHGTLSLLAGIDLLPGRSTRWSETATAAGNSSNTKRLDAAIRPAPRSS